MWKIRFRDRLLAYTILLAMTLVALPAAAQQAQYYVLDGFGGVHTGGSAPMITPATPYFGFDIAKDIVYVRVGTGDAILVLDGFGGVHTGGALTSGDANPRTPYWGWNIARAIVHRTVPPRAAGSTGFGNKTIDTTSSTFTTISSATVVAPDDGFLVVTGTANFGCTFIVANLLSAEFNLDVDSTAGDQMGYFVRVNSCAQIARETVAITRLFPVTAGAHTVNLLARKSSASGQVGLFVLRSSVTVIYVN